MAKRILMIESEKSLSRLVSLRLQEQGYQVVLSSDAKSGLKNIQDRDFDLIFLDLNLPDQDGLELMEQIRQEKARPIVMLVDRTELPNILSETDKLADDYMIKPFAVEELLAKAQELLKPKKRRTYHKKAPYHDLVLDESNRSVIRKKEAIPLTNREYALLATLLRHTNTVMTREELLEHVWSHSSREVETNIVDVYVRYLRRKIDLSGRDSYIQTVRGLGYVIRG